MLKKISLIIVVNVIFFLIIELSVRFALKILNLPLVYKISNIENNRYDFLTGYYNLPNKKEGVVDKFYYAQSTDKYGFNLDGKSHPTNLETKKKNEIRIFILGGSTVQGRFLKDKFDPISARIEQKLNDKDKNDNKTFFVINAGAPSFFSVQELSLIQNRIIYALKPDAIIVLNGTNDATSIPSKDFYLSNSHRFQTSFQKNLNNQSKNFFYFIDDFLSRNLSTYFSLKKGVEKILGIYLFDEEIRKYHAKIKNTSLSEKREYRYYYNMRILSKLANENIPIIAYLQPQMLPNNFDNLNDKDKIIYNKYDLSKPNYFKDKQEFYERILNNIKKYNNLNSESFSFYDLSDILSKNSKNEPFYSDRVHYNHNSREIISDRIFNDLQKIFFKN